jgi:hypothetical protein
MAEADNSPISGTIQARNGFGVITDPSVGKATQFKPGESGNPAGKPKGAVHISQHIQKLMEDEAFEANILDAKIGIKEYRGAPVQAIIQVAITKAVNGDDKARDWLAKYGWSQKIENEHSGEQTLTIKHVRG